VFNDDKKTELIGEMFVQLDEVIRPGGGQADAWHGLNCKGKYAGEVRMELTYYDSRPKPEKAEADKNRESLRNGVNDGQVVSAKGPRELTPVKRRPLPSNPTAAQASMMAGGERPLPQSRSGPRSYQTPPHSSRQIEPTSSHHRHTYYGGMNQRPDDAAFAELDPHLKQATHTPSFNDDQQYSQNYDESLDHYPSHGGHEGNLPSPHLTLQDNHPPPPPRHTNHTDPLGNTDVLYQNNDPRSFQSRPHSMMTLPHSHSDPGVPYQFQQQSHTSRHSMHPPVPKEIHYDQTREEIYRSSSGQYQPVSPQVLQNGSFEVYDDQQAAWRNQSEGVQYNPQGNQRIPSRSSYHPAMEEENDLPPPPPVHRSSAPAVAPYHPSLPSHMEPDLAPAPLRITPSREDFRRDTYEPYEPPLPYDHRYTHPSTVDHSRPVSRDAMAPSSLRNEIPASLVPGIPQPYASEPSTIRQDDRMSLYSTPKGQYSQYAHYSQDQGSHHRQLSQQEYQTPPNYSTPPRQHQLLQEESMSSQYHPTSSPIEPRASQSYSSDAAPLIKPRAVSPAEAVTARTGRTPVRSTPTRKSLSPRPPPAESSERRLSSTPFGPDSYDALNPRLSQVKSTGNSPNGDDETGSIVGFDGRVIDPSDHLPVDSWAPEPEPKGKAKEKPYREREKLVGARDLGRQRNDDIRQTVMGSSPIAAGTPTYSPLVPGSGNRNKLQKRPRGQISSAPNSAPSSIHRDYENIPTLPNVSPTPLRPAQHHGYSPSPYSASPRNGANGAPPIPAKIPLNSTRGDDLTRLSEEMSRIDIGVGNGGRRAFGARRIGAAPGRF
jgi:hypothetical protein